MSTTAFTFALLAVCCWGAASTFDKLALNKVDPFIALVIRSALIGLTMLLVGALSGRFGAVREVPWKVYLYLFCAAIPAAVLGQYFYYHALKLDQASRVAAITSSYPLIAVVIAALVLKEPMTARKLIGILTVIAGIYLLKGEGSASVTPVQEQETAMPERQ